MGAARASLENNRLITFFSGSLRPACGGGGGGHSESKAPPSGGP
jgi:hypothetical protein